MFLIRVGIIDQSLMQYVLCCLQVGSTKMEQNQYMRRERVPGDTLPWNRPRSVESGRVMEPPERAVLRIAGRTSGCSLRLAV